MKDKLLLTVTVGEFIEALRTGLGLHMTETEDEPSKKHFIYGMKSLAQLLGCSLSTANRIKKSGVINAAIAQNGKVIVIDADLAIDLLKIQNKKRK